MYDLYKDLRCLTCDGQSVYDSDSEFSKDIKKKTEELLQLGKGEKEIKEFFVESYGNEILFVPSNNYFIWVAPYIIILFILIIYLLIKKGKK